MAEDVAAPLEAYAGEWTLQALPMEGDEALVQLRMTATDNTDGWNIIFDHLENPVPGRVVELEGDSVSVAFGPYPSALQADVMVTTETILKAEGDQLAGHFTATYETGDPLEGRIAGTKTNQ